MDTKYPSISLKMLINSSVEHPSSKILTSDQRKGGKGSGSRGWKFLSVVGPKREKKGRWLKCGVNVVVSP